MRGCRWFMVLLAIAALLPAGRGQPPLPPNPPAEEWLEPPLPPEPDLLPPPPPIPSGPSLSRLMFEPQAVAIPRVAIRHSEDRGVGYPDGFTSIEGFLPYSPDGLGDTLWYADVRGLISNDGLLGGNIGGGYRHGSIGLNKIFGFYGFYDFRETDRFTFHQLSPGIEILSEFCDFRANGYVPIGPQHQRFVNSFTNFRFRGHHIIFDNTQFFEVAMYGLDFEFGAPLPVLPSVDPRIYVGYYFYDVDEGPPTDGIRTRLELLAGDNVAVNFTFAHDRLFETTFTVAAVFRWPNGFRPRGCTGRRTVGQRMSQPVHRQQNIVVREQGTFATVAAIDPATREPIFVNHANSNAPAGGDGTVERPFQTLLDLELASLPNDILFVQADSTFTGEVIFLQDNQRLLGEGKPHLFTSLQGTYLMPRATNGIALPVVAMAPGDAVTLANNNEVSGFTITDPALSGIFGVSITNFNINCNTIRRAFNHGIELFDAAGSGTVADNTISDSGQSAATGYAVQIDNAFTTTLNVSITGNSFTDDFSGGVGLINSAGAQTTATISGNTITGAFDAIDVLASNTSQAITTITGNTITGSFLDGIFFFGENSARHITTVSGNTISGSLGDGINFSFDNSANLTGIVSGNTISGNSLAGMSVNLISSAVGSIGIRSNTFTGNTSFGVDANSDNSALMCLQLQNNTSDTGYLLDQIGSSTFNAENSLGTNTGTITQMGTITIQPVGFCNLP